MIKRLILLFALLLFAVAVQAHEGEEHDEEPEDIPYLQLGANFSVPELPDWEIETSDNSVLFFNQESDARIYVTTVDTQDIEAAIAETIADLSELEFDAPFVEGRIGRTTGTWTVQLFRNGDTSITAYGMLQSNQVYVAVFVEDSPDYEAYQYPIRPPSINADETLLAINAASLAAAETVFPDQTFGEATNLSFPNPANTLWVQVDHPIADSDSSITSASFLYEDIVFVTLVSGDTQFTAQLSNAFNSVFLGFVITPDNSLYLLLGLTFASVIMIVLIGSMWLRYRNVLKDMALVEQLAEEE